MGSIPLQVQYTVYGHQMVTEAFDLTSDHLFLNAALCLPFVDGHLQEPVEVELHLPPDWKVVTELEEVSSRPPTYRAQTYDELVDSPLDAGHPLVLTIRPHGIPHRISICGEGGNYEAHRLEEDLAKVVDASVRLVGESPLHSYTFFVHLSDVPDGGLEHASSNSAVVLRNSFAPLERYQRFLSLQSHEYFHLWNVKRIRPKALGPFDYTREVNTGQLWWMEGTTDYFSDLILRRAGLYTPAKYLEEAAKIAKVVVSTPGRNALSLEELSRIAWVDLYQPFEESPNQSVSYYGKGYLVSLCLDLEIRHRTEARASLESVVRLLWTEYGKPGRGLEEGELQAVAERATGLDLSEFFDRYIRGTTEVDARALCTVRGPDLRAPPEVTGRRRAGPGLPRHPVRGRGGVRSGHPRPARHPRPPGRSQPGGRDRRGERLQGRVQQVREGTRGVPARNPGRPRGLPPGYLRHLSLTTGKAPPPRVPVRRRGAGQRARA